MERHYAGVDYTGTEAEGRAFLTQILAGLLYLRQKRVVHGDLKLENILCYTYYRITLDGQVWSTSVVRIADFGSAHKSYEKSEVGQRVTLRSSAPEVLKSWKDEKRFDTTFASDIWSLGHLLYQLLTGALVYDLSEKNLLNEKTLDEEMKQRLKSFRKNLAKNKRLSKSAKDLLCRMLVFDPKERITLDEIRVHEWMRGGISDVNGLSLL